MAAGKYKWNIKQEEITIKGRDTVYGADPFNESLKYR